MKKIFLLLLLSLTVQPSHSFEAFCSHPTEDGNVLNPRNNHVGAYSNFNLECSISGEEDSMPYSVNLKTFGPGVEFALGQGYAISCPFVSRHRLKKMIEKNGSWSIVGPSASAGILLGGNASLLLNHRGAACVVAGINLVDFGAKAGISAVTFKEFKQNNEN